MDPQMIEHCLAAADDAEFATRLRDALGTLPSGTLPLAQACTQGGLVDETRRTLSVMSSRHSSRQALARVGVFFTERVGGCNCHDDPAESTVYAVIEVRLSADDPTVHYRYVDDA